MCVLSRSGKKCVFAQGAEKCCSARNKNQRDNGAHKHLKVHAPKRVAVNRAVFDKVKGCCFTLPLRN